MPNPQITPEQARELLDGILDDNCLPYHVVGGLSGYLEIRDADNNLVAESLFDREAALCSAAPDLAETVAGLRYEYAVQKLDGNEWKLTNLCGRALESYEDEYAVWCARPIPQSDIADRGPGWRIVRRLVSEPEVIE